MLALVTAVVLAAAMYGLYHVGHYYFIIVPAVAALGVAALFRVAVAKGHCRNPVIAMVIGILLALVLYLGSYYAGMLYVWGPEAIMHPEAFPEYVRLRLKTDTVRSTHDYDDSKPRHGSLVVNVGLTLFEFGMVLLIVPGAGFIRSRKPYCENCRRWNARETTLFEPGAADELMAGLQEGSARKLAALCARAPYMTLPNTTMAVDYCPSLKEGSTRDCAAFLSLKSVASNVPGVGRDPFDQSKGKLLARFVQLSPDEFPALAPRFPLFETYAGRAAVAALLPQKESEGEEIAQQTEGAFAQITALPPDDAGKVLTRKRIVLGNASALLGIVLLFGGIGLLAWGATLMEHNSPQTVPWDGGLALCIVGGLFLVGAIAGMFIDPGYGANGRLRKAFKAELSRRSGKIVEADDPDALFVEVVPKLKWGKLSLETATDVGLLVVDAQRKEIRFEGDQERWRVPAQAITGLGLEFFTVGHGAGQRKIYFVVMQASRREGFWEAPIRERTRNGAFMRHKKRAEKLLLSIAEMCGQTRQFVAPGRK